tara:strand:+ start:211 stop:450 length:240 start_codon:yes stop_codon:yes gene_type:complete
MRRLEEKNVHETVTCVFSADDKIDQEIDMEMDEDELWGLPQFLDEDQLMNDSENVSLAPVISRVESTNSDSTCHSDFGI